MTLFELGLLLLLVDSYGLKVAGQVLVVFGLMHLVIRVLLVRNHFGKKEGDLSV